MGAKLRILELDAKRQMEKKLKEAMYSYIFQRRVLVPYLVIRVRRHRLLEDSLDQVFFINLCISFLVCTKI